MKSIICFFKRIKERITENPRAGIGAMDTLIIIIISVVAGALILALVSATMPELWESVMGRVRNMFS